MTSVTTVRTDSGARQGHVSEKLRHLVSGLPPGSISLGTVIDRLGASGTGLCLLLFSLTSLIPGIAPVLGVALCAVAVGMVVGRAEPMVPERLRRWRMNQDRLHAGVRRLGPSVAWIERYLRPRASWLLTGVGTRLIGLASFVNGVLIVLPIPFGNTAPAVAMLILSTGLVAADGMAVAVGLLATLVALVVDIAMIVLGYTAVSGFLSGMS